jgi:hypothetical protein
MDAEFRRQIGMHDDELPLGCDGSGQSKEERFP